MPYIEPSKRPTLDPIVELMDKNVRFPGDLSYIIFKFLVHQKKRWSEWCMFKGAIEFAVDEFYHRHIRPYEQGKMERNGDIE